MNGLPEPYQNGTHLVVRGRHVVVTDRAPNADSWHYRGTPADLAGDVVTFGHDEAAPAHRPPPGPRPVGELLPDVVGDLLARAGLSPDRFQQEQARAHSPLGDLLETVAESIRRGIAEPNVREAYTTYMESGAPRA